MPVREFVTHMVESLLIDGNSTISLSHMADDTETIARLDETSHNHTSAVGPLGKVGKRIDITPLRIPKTVNLATIDKRVINKEFHCIDAEAIVLPIHIVVYLDTEAKAPPSRKSPCCTFVLARLTNRSNSGRTAGRLPVDHAT